MAARTLSLYTFILAIALMLGACKKDDFAMETTNELHQLATDIVAKVQEGDERKASVDAAQKLLDERRPALAVKMKEVVGLKDGQISAAAAEHVNKTRAEAGLKVAGVSLSLMSEATSDPELGAKLAKLTDDFTKLTDGN